MSKTRAFVQSFRRMSTPDVFRRASKSDSIHLDEVVEEARALQSRSKSSPDVLQRTQQKTILSLPVELLSQILAQLSLADLCAFRLACKTTHHLTSSGEIVSRWLYSNTDQAQNDLFPPPNPPTLIYALEQQRRSRMVHTMSVLYVDYVEHEILRYTLRHQNLQQHHAAFRVVWEQLREKMKPLLGVLQHYLDRLGDLLVRLAGEEGNCNDEAFRAKLKAAERKIFDSYSPEQVLATNKFFMFVTWVNNQVLNRPSYAGTIERAVRGWLVDPLQHSHLLLILVLCNLSSVGKLINLKSFKERRRAAETEIRHLNPEDNVFWSQRWIDTGVRYGRSPGQEQASTVLKLKLEAGDVWIGSARAVLVEHELIEAGSEMEYGTPQQCTEFLRDIAGYDILHISPAMAHEMFEQPGVATYNDDFV